jgi:DNA-binding NarL/FixJ family response regulator
MNTMTDPTHALVHIMLVDDHPLVRDGLRARLEAVPHLRVVAEADSGAEALALVETLLDGDAIDLVLMDITMREGSGIDATARLSASHPGIAVLMLSMHDKLEYVTQAMQAGARGYVLKDAPGKDIVLAIDTVMAGGIYYSAALARQLARPAAQLSGQLGDLAPGQDGQLTMREQEVLQHIANGESNKQIARELDLSVRTVETHRLNIKRKLGIEGQAELIKFAVQHVHFGNRGA